MTATTRPLTDVGHMDHDQWVSALLARLLRLLEPYADRFDRVMEQRSAQTHSHHQSHRNLHEKLALGLEERGLDQELLESIELLAVRYESVAAQIGLHPTSPDASVTQPLNLKRDALAAWGDIPGHRDRQGPADWAAEHLFTALSSCDELLGVIATMYEYAAGGGAQTS